MASRGDSSTALIHAQYVFDSFMQQITLVVSSRLGCSLSSLLSISKDDFESKDSFPLLYVVYLLVLLCEDRTAVEDDPRDNAAMNAEADIRGGTSQIPQPIAGKQIVFARNRVDAKNTDEYESINAAVHSSSVIS